MAKYDHLPIYKKVLDPRLDKGGRLLVAFVVKIVSSDVVGRTEKTSRPLRGLHKNVKASFPRANPSTSLEGRRTGLMLFRPCVA